MTTLYWHDYETWGANPAIDRPSQFAGVRTDEDLNIIGEPLVMYCRPPLDIWPQPMACLITGITPQAAAREGVSEVEFIRRIHDELSQPGTCSVGYNTLRFDDEVTRYTLFRNFYDPYEREWRNGNSRWDIIDMVRLVYALRPEGIEWPMVEGKPSFKLENLTVANGISHAAAHDAFSDVEATIAMARLVKERQPELYHYVFQHRVKQKVGALINVEQRKPLLHISSRFPSTRGCAGLIAPLAWHPVNKNAVIVFDLSEDPSPLLHLSAEEIRARVFASNDELPEGEARIPLKLVHLNKCPILTTPKLLTEQAQKRLGIDKAQCEAHWQMLRHWDIADKLKAMYKLDSFTPLSDPETQLYGGFVGAGDKSLMQKLRDARPDELARDTYIFEDERLNAMLPRYKARNFFDQLSPEEKEDWLQFAKARLFGREFEDSTYALNAERLLAELDVLAKTYAEQSEKLAILEQLRAYVAMRERQLQGVPLLAETLA